MEDKPVVLMEIDAAFRHPVQFKNIEYVRIGSYLKKLKDFPEKERELWRIFDETPFERGIAQENLLAEDVLLLIDYPAYFSLLNLPLPDSRDGIIRALESEEILLLGVSGMWNITNLGVILFARDISKFSSLKRKAIRVIQYKGENRIETIREQAGGKGYACGFKGLIDFLNTILPSNEVIGKALRKDVPMFPDIAIRELVANALPHQDFYLTGTAPMIEIFSNRVEITNPGRPLVKTDRFLDSPPKSRNEALASFMRRIGVCEERGSGVDKVIFETEFYQLPAPLFEETDEHTRSVLFARKDFEDMGKEDRVRACYQHACLQYVQRKHMTNKSLRDRFGLEESKSAQVTRVINATLEGKLVKKIGVSEARKDAKYIPYWS
ncbi:transcriptional regulator [Candidatus Scalindua japonica]|uniref:Transcriptional regulator n=1 Tax=Candidatus Scalindua japonica TaxID=1284222 RepID=A0A286U0C1_9BACT|nr:ATP-binding protein [Candidatus Scalindua japonica]GAX61576.1 transcriptional regulator [Candidatus Scalindua japonica]